MDSAPPTRGWFRWIPGSLSSTDGPRRPYDLRVSPSPRGPRARKALGQHFLVDTGVLADIAEAVRVPSGGLLIEIGAGTGQLTGALLAAGHELVALEIEQRLLAHLSTRFAGAEKLRLMEGDARLFDFAEAVPDGRPFSVVGNLPYFAANPIIRHLLEGEPRPDELVIMVQREVARELFAKPGKLSLLGISVQIYAEAEHLFDVPPIAFDPPPAVRSTMVRLTLREKPLVPAARNTEFFALVRGAFRNPRKQIHNSLARMPGGDPEAVPGALAVAGIDPLRRPETLAIEEWLALLEALDPAVPHA